MYIVSLYGMYLFLLSVVTCLKDNEDTSTIDVCVFHVDHITSYSSTKGIRIYYPCLTAKFHNVIHALLSIHVAEVVHNPSITTLVTTIYSEAYHSSLAHECLVISHFGS